jgi:hypothetical protein
MHGLRVDFHTALYDWSSDYANLFRMQAMLVLSHRARRQPPALFALSHGGFGPGVAGPRSPEQLNVAVFADSVHIDRMHAIAFMHGFRADFSNARFMNGTSDYANILRMQVILALAR